MLQIRVATSGDIADMHDIRLAVRENRLRDASWLTPAVYEACLEPTGAANTWVARVDDAIRGFANARIAEQDIWALFVEPGHEGNGLGSALLDTAVDWLFQQGVDEISLTTAPGTRADDFYRRAGWQRGETAPNGDVRYRLNRSAAKASGTQRTSSC